MEADKSCLALVRTALRWNWLVSAEETCCVFLNLPKARLGVNFGPRVRVHKHLEAAYATNEVKRLVNIEVIHNLSYDRITDIQLRYLTSD